MVLTEGIRAVDTASIEPFFQNKKENNKLYEELLSIIRKNNIKITTRDEAGQHQELNLAQIELVLREFFPAITGVKGTFYDGQLRSGMKNALTVLNAIAAKPPEDRKMTVETLITLATIDRMDDDVIKTFNEQMLYQNNKRTKTRDELKLLTAELKIYSVIQAKVSQSMAEKGGDRGSAELNIAEFNLLEHSLYGYATEEKFKESAEYILLQKISTPEDDDFLSIKDFLQSGNKASGQMQGLKDVYSYSKDNHDLSNFATMVNDRARPVNDKVSELTTLLNDSSTHYNSAIEACSRFVQKYNDILREILRSV